MKKKLITSMTFVVLVLFFAVSAWAATQGTILHDSFHFSLDIPAILP
jgi:hypothetical protein